MDLTADSIDEFYIAYFEAMAAQHCGHVINAPKPHFYVNNFIDSLSEINEAIRSKLSPEGFSMILDTFDDQIDMNDAMPGILSGAFSIIAKFDSRNPASIRAVRSSCRAKARTVLMQMKRDTFALNEGILSDKQIEVIDNADGMRLGVIGETFSGWAYTFKWRYPEHLFF